ncbi:T-lymphocyte surface antigen Ly-9-like [Eleutherodactylus coqui]|uniref:T-lymphocyte surface antigen Ly-9-like n=1 Tax=Eleutherodactylus coqui TaxID=57060 RepID=UPI0034619120
MVLPLLFLMPLWGVLSDTTQQTLSAMCGGSILFQVNVSRDVEIISVFWSHTGTKKKSMLAIVKPGYLKIINPRFHNRVNSQQPDFSMNLSNLNEEDNGMYEARIYTNVETMHRFFQLQVHANNQSHRVQWSILQIIGLGTLAVFFNTMT